MLCAVPVIRKGFPTPGVVCCLLKNLGLCGWVPDHSTPTFCSWACFCLLLSHASCAYYQPYGPRPCDVQSQGRLPGGPSQAALEANAQGIPTPANLTAPRCPRQGSQPGIPPPGRGAPHCPVQEPSVGFLPTTELEGKTGPFLPSCGDPPSP